MTDRGGRWLAALWLALVVAGTLVLIRQSVVGWAIDTDVRALLPPAAADPAVRRATQVQSDRALRTVMVLVGHADPKVAVAAAEQAARTLKEDPVFDSVRVDWSGTDATVPAADVDAGPGLLPRAVRRRLQAGDGEAVLQRALQRLYGVAGLAARTRFEDDPLGLLDQFLSQAEPPFALVPVDGRLRRRIDGTEWVLVLATLRGEAFGLDVAAAAVRALDRAHAQAAAAGAQWHDAGFSRHAERAARQGRTEMSRIGLGSALGVALLLIGMLRRAAPLLLTLVSLGSGALVGLAACVLLFERVHILALVMGSSLVGVGVDYSLHYLTARGDGRARRDAIAAGVTLGLLTTATAYAGLLLTGVPGLAQVAVLACVGLSVAWLAVMGVYPRVGAARLGQVPEPVERLARFSLRGRRGFAAGLLLAGAAIAAAGGARLTTQDNVRALYAAAPDLIAQENAARRIVGGLDSSRVLVLQAPDVQQVLQATERATDALQALAPGVLGRWMAVTDVLPSLRRQRSDVDLVRQAACAGGGLLPRLAAQLGLAQAWVDAQCRRAPVPLTAERWRATPLAEGYRDLLDDSTTPVTSVVRLGGLTDAPALVALVGRLQDEGVPVALVDPVADASAALHLARRRATLLVIIAVGLVGLILVVRYGVRRGAAALAPTLLATSVCLGLLGLTGQPFTLFHLFALLLVQGVAVDYAIFLNESGDHRARTILAVLLSAATTLLAFGLLALSTTPALSAFGWTVAVGVTTALLAALALSGVEGAGA